MKVSNLSLPTTRCRDRSAICITAEYLRLCVHYDPASGIFTWLHRADRTPQWNSRYAEKIAGKVTWKRDARVIICISDTYYFAHRLAWLYMTGEWPKEVIDHADGDPLNNCWSNLRMASRSQNQANSRKPRSNTSGYKGVSFCKRRSKWEASISLRNRSVFLGYYETAQDAHAAYWAAAQKHFGEFARAA